MHAFRACAAAAAEIAALANINIPPAAEADDF